jgi:hypothetical protein
MYLALALAVAVVAALRGMWSPCGLSMLSSLNPVSEAARGNRFWPTACWYVAGALAGGALLGAGCAVAAAGYGRLHASTALTWTLVLLAALVAVGSDTAIVGRSLPDHPRQVDERWLTKYRRWIYAGGYGVQIGAGFATYIMTAAVYLMAGLAVLTGDPGQAFAAGVVFGSVRGLAIVVAGRARSGEALRDLLARVDARASAALALACAVEVSVAAVAAWRLAGPVPALAVTLAGAAVVAVGSRRLAPVH